MNPVETIRREVGRALNSVRQAYRAVSAGIDLAKRIQLVNLQALEQETQDNVELFQQFGFASGLPDGTQLIVLPLGGRTSHSIVVATEHGDYRFKVDNKGEAAIYNQWGDFIHLKQDRSIRVKSAVQVKIETPEVLMQAATRVRLETPDFQVTGEVKDRCDSDGLTMEAMRNTYNGHVHGGVQGGASNTSTTGSVM